MAVTREGVMAEAVVDQMEEVERELAARKAEVAEEEAVAESHPVYTLKKATAIVELMILAGVSRNPTKVEAVAEEEAVAPVAEEEVVEQEVGSRITKAAFHSDNR